MAISIRQIISGSTRAIQLIGNSILVKKMYMGFPQFLGYSITMIIKAFTFIPRLVVWMVNVPLVLEPIDSVRSLCVVLIKQ